MFHSVLKITCGKLWSCDRREFLEDVCKLILNAGVESGCRCCVTSDWHVLVCLGIDDVTSVDVNEEMVATEEISTQHWAVDISQYERPFELAES